MFYLLSNIEHFELFSKTSLEIIRHKSYGKEESKISFLQHQNDTYKQQHEHNQQSITNKAPKLQQHKK